MPFLLATMVVFAEQRARFVAPARVADLGGAAAEQHDGPVPRPLEPAQHHDLHQAAHMQAVGGAVEADIGGDALLCGERVEGRTVGVLVDIAALRQHAHEIGGEHRRSTRWLWFRPAAQRRRALGARGRVSQGRRGDNATPVRTAMIAHDERSPLYGGARSGRLGMMSGTSLDGVDAALIETDGVTVAAFGPWHTAPYSG